MAGGMGTRLLPSTYVVSKQLLPVYNKPMIYYPLSTLLIAGVKEVLIICNQKDKKSFSELLGNGNKFGISITYAIQMKPNGIAEFTHIAKNFINGFKIILVLGDNLFYGNDLGVLLSKADRNKSSSTIFGYKIKDPHRFAVVKLDKDGKPLKITEKPKKNISNIAVPGLYFYDETASEIGSFVKPNSKGELDITNLNNLYLKKKSLSVEIMRRGFTWFDTGTPDSLIEASNFVKTIEQRQGFMISCPEEISFRSGFINKKNLRKIISQEKNPEYKTYLKNL